MPEETITGRHELAEDALLGTKHDECADPVAAHSRRPYKVKRILDVKTLQNGRRSYKVEWESSWEDEDVLLSDCQKLVDDFWTFINSARQCAASDCEPPSSSTGKEPDAPSIKLDRDDVSIDDVDNVRQDSDDMSGEENSVESDPGPATSLESLAAQFNSPYVDASVCYSCKACRKQLSSRRHWKRHYQTHVEDRSFACSSCNKSFKFLKDLTRHERNHTGERLFHCPVCLKSFKRNDHLHRHAQTHQKQAADAADDPGKPSTKIRKPSADEVRSEKGPVENWMLIAAGGV